MDMGLKDREWRAFLVGKLFKVSGTTTTHPSVLIRGGRIPRITRAATSNGLDGFYKNSATEVAGVLTVDSTTTGVVRYQGNDFIATDHVEKVALVDGSRMSRHLGLFIQVCIEKAIFGKYGYGYGFSQDRIKKQKILLSVTAEGSPDYQFMECYARKVENNNLQKYIDYIRNVRCIIPPPPSWKIKNGRFLLLAIFLMCRVRLRHRQGVL